MSRPDRDASGKAAPAAHRPRLLSAEAFDPRVPPCTIAPGEDPVEGELARGL